MFGDWTKLFEQSDGTLEVDGCLMNVATPTQLVDGRVPFVPEDGFICYDIKLLTEYYTSLAEGDIRVDYINGVLADFDVFEPPGNVKYNATSMFGCHYCRRTWLYAVIHCQTCDMAMCPTCFTKNVLKYVPDNDEIPSWYCTHHLDDHCVFIERHPRDMGCERCGTTPNATPGIWQCDRIGDYDYCPNCPQDEWTEAKVTYESLVPPSYFATYGSLLDWVPVLQEIHSGDQCYVNMNMASPNYGRVSLSTQELAVTGLSLNSRHVIVPGTLNEVLKDISRTAMERAPHLQVVIIDEVEYTIESELRITSLSAMDTTPVNAIGAMGTILERLGYDLHYTYSISSSN